MVKKTKVNHLPDNMLHTNECIRLAPCSMPLTGLYVSYNVAKFQELYHSADPAQFSFSSGSQKNIDPSKLYSINSVKGTLTMVWAN